MTHILLWVAIPLSSIAMAGFFFAMGKILGRKDKITESDLALWRKRGLVPKG